MRCQRDLRALKKADALTLISQMETRPQHRRLVAGTRPATTLSPVAYITTDFIRCAINPTERYKMMCHAYRYNGKGLQIISDAIHPVQQDILGFKPLVGALDYAPKKDTSPVSVQKPIDKFKEKYLIRLIQDCKRKGTKLVFYVSPMYGQEKRSVYYDAIVSLYRKYDVPFFYHQTDKRFVYNRNYFKDGVHLNNIGAEQYTKLVVTEIKGVLKP